ncbi:protein THEMIS isoform X1 [Trichosurus vulpecula]|uniref:protein THEMIS isoform X1 n=1 Tax=Trichosurus vulpecula TaxID=9337 RepID=UPI00186ABF2E|nr:protein THEMIS isoform X1 [Trichosurus vulpecula]
MTSTLQEFIHSLNPRTLPRVLQIQSGIYFQGSIYEMFGNECSLSTGEVIKVNSFKIKKVMANTCKENEDGQCSPKFELPLNFPGLFKIMTDRVPYHTMGDITRAVYIGPNRLSHPCFYHQKDINLGNLTISPGEPIMLNSIEEVNGEMLVNCGVVRDNQNHSFTIPLSQEGEFYECEDEHMYTLKEIAEWKIPKSRKRIVKFTDISNKWNSIYPLPKDFDGLLSLTPIYEIQAVMKFRKDIVRILSDLDVEVKDITDCYDAKCFLQLLSTEDLFEKTSKEFPMAVEVIEGPQGNPLASGLLQPGKTIVIHKKYQASRILASEIRSDSPKRHFLIPTSYKGKFKRRPREFPTAYDLEIVKSDKEQLHVVATKGFDSPYEELSSVSVGDQFLVQCSQTTEVLCKGIKKEVGVLACEKILKKAYEPVLLPLYMEGGFIEVIHDKNQYQLSKLCAQFRLPFNVKVSVRDLSIEDDILAAIPGLQLEEEITDSYLLISDLTNPSESWEIPVSRLGMSVQLVSSTVDVIDSFPVRTIVEEISEEQYYMMRRYENLALHPPPRPPKKPSIMERKPDFLAPHKLNIMDPPKSPKSLHVETAKNLHSQQATAASKLPVSCQIDLTHPETEQDVIRTTALAETSVMRAKTVLIKDDLERKLKDEHDHKHINENLAGDVKQKLQERTFHSKAHS